MGTVIKAGQSTKLLQRLTTVDLADHLAEARAVLKQAREQATRALEDGRAEALRLRLEAEERGHADGSRRGYEKGYSEGNAAGHDAGFKTAHDEAMQKYDEQCASLVANFQRLAKEFEERKEDLLVSTEKHLLDFSVRLATKLTFAIGLAHRETALANVDRAVRLVGSKTDLTVRVHPDDVSAIRTFAAEVLEQSESSRTVKIIEDDAFAPGGCKLQTNAVEVDGTLESQIEEIVELLMGRPTAHA